MKLIPFFFGIVVVVIIIILYNIYILARVYRETMRKVKIYIANGKSEKNTYYGNTKRGAAAIVVRDEKNNKSTRSSPRTHSTVRY